MSVDRLAAARSVLDSLDGAPLDEHPQALEDLHAAVVAELDALAAEAPR